MGDLILVFARLQFSLCPFSLCDINSQIDVRSARKVSLYSHPCVYVRACVYDPYSEGRLLAAHCRSMTHILTLSSFPKVGSQQLADSGYV